MSRPVAAPCWDRSIPARTEFCADPDGFQTTWLRSCASRHQRRPNFRAESRSCCLPHARRDRTSPHYWRTPYAGIGTPRPRAAARVFCASMADGFHNHPPLGLARGPLAAHPATPAVNWFCSRNDRRISRACCPPIGATAERTSGSARPRKTGSRRGGASRTWWRPRPQSASSASSRCWRRSTLRPSSAGSTG